MLKANLVMEIQDDDGVWHLLGRHPNGYPPGSFSNNSEEGRDVVMFECHGDYSVIQKSLAGADIERAGGSLRELVTAGLEELARLKDGETYELQLRTDRMPRAAPFRFRHERMPG